MSEQNQPCKQDIEFLAEIITRQREGTVLCEKPLEFNFRPARIQAYEKALDIWGAKLIGREYSDANPKLNVERELFTSYVGQDDALTISCLALRDMCEIAD